MFLLSALLYIFPQFFPCFQYLSCHMPDLYQVIVALLGLVVPAELMLQMVPLPFLGVETLVLDFPAHTPILRQAGYIFPAYG